MTKTLRQSLQALMVIAVFQNPALAATGLKAGAYEIEVALELPYVTDTGSRKIARLCLGDTQSATLGLVVLSHNNPLGKCPVSNVTSSTGSLTFDVICPGGNAAAGRARYDIMPEQFRGRIAMKMGGKNMTMSEIQVGRRIGPCDMLEQSRPD